MLPGADPVHEYRSGPMRKGRSIVACAILCSLFLSVRKARAFDSAGADSMRTHTAQTPLPPYPFGLNYFPIASLADSDIFSLNPIPTDGPLHGLRLMSRTLHALHGGFDPDETDSRI